ncbi:hypothetical protein FQN60_002527 [Etheostoma spectabile]|uniref:Uncharacterized protein n=1 Tax=Etheostoma spectabile TaxID=54343 RepID=A0A5J5CBE7_9PERO|nr:hypothetical protein FQN60_002527 [Etheostoma spectabile]
MTKFSLLEPIQILFDFVGQDDIASEIFVVQEATSPRSIESTSSGSIMDHGIKLMYCACSYSGNSVGSTK